MLSDPVVLVIPEVHRITDILKSYPTSFLILFFKNKFTTPSQSY